MLQVFTTSFAEGGRTPPSAYLFLELRKVDAHSLRLSSKKNELVKLRASFYGVNPDHPIMAELTWRVSGLEKFGVYGTGRSSDEAIERALSVFYSIFPSGKIKGETDNVQDCAL